MNVVQPRHSLLGPTLETERLILRPTAEEDLDGWAELMSGDSSRFIGGPMARAASWRNMASIAGSWAMKGFAPFSVIEKASGRWIGRVGPWHPEEWPAPEIAWGLIDSACGKGYATESAIAAIDWAFDHLGWTEVNHVIDPENLPSIAVAERLGSRKLRPAKLPAPYDHVIADAWGQTREEWRARFG